MDSNYELVKNGQLFFGNGSVQEGIMIIIRNLLILVNAVLLVRIVYLFIERANGDENGQITKQIVNCFKAAIIINVVGGFPLVNQILQYYFGVNV